MKKEYINKYKLEQSISSIILVVFLAFAGLYFLGLNSTGLFDVDEAIFAEASHEMLETGDFVTPKYNNEPRYHKPPLIYWLQAWSMDNLGKTSFAARLPSAILGFLTVFAFYLFISGMTSNRRLAITASVILGANLSFLIIAQAATADMALNFFVITSTLSLIANLFAKRRSIPAPFMVGIALGLAMLAKGPVSLMVPFFVIGLATFMRPNVIYNLKCVNPVFILIAMIITLIPWVQFIVDAKGFDFFKEFILVHNLGRFTSAMGNTQSSSHFYYIVVLIFGFFPWVLFLPSAIIHASKNFIKNLRSEKVEEALPSLGLIWFLSIVIFFSFSATKLPHYILPAYAGAALMIACRLESLWNKPFSRWNIIWFTPVIFIFSSVFVMFKYIPDILLGKFSDLPQILQKAILILQTDYGVKIKQVKEQTFLALSQNINISSSAFSIGILAIIGVSIAIWFIYKRKRSGVLLLGALSFVILLLVSLSVVPTIYKFTQKPLANIAEKIKQDFNTDNDKLYFIAIHQPSVRFISGVEFKSLSSISGLLKEKIVKDNAVLWFVLKQERLNNLSNYIPEYINKSYCEGGYCLVKSTSKSIKDFLMKK